METETWGVTGKREGCNRHGNISLGTIKLDYRHQTHHTGAHHTKLHSTRLICAPFSNTLKCQKMQIPKILHGLAPVAGFAQQGQSCLWSQAWMEGSAEALVPPDRVKICALSGQVWLVTAENEKKLINKRTRRGIFSLQVSLRQLLGFFSLSNNLGFVMTLGWLGTNCSLY